MKAEEIEKAAKEEYLSNLDYSVKELVNTFVEGAKFANKIWQERTRWIPVEEKLPLRQSRTRQILGKNKYVVSVVFISCTDEGYLDSLESLKREFTHWKEIE